MSTTDDCLTNNAHYAATFDGPLPGTPSKHLAVVACMDARLDVSAVLGLAVGEAHVIRNAGGVVTDDVVRSLAISQRLLDTREIVLVHHTHCGMLGITDDEFRSTIERETGIRPPWTTEAFTDVDESVRQSIERLRTNPFLPRTDAIRGFVFDVDTGKLREVSARVDGA